MLSKYIPKRINSFDAGDSMTVVDYGCGAGRYTVLFSKKVGKNGKVYAVDIEPKSIKELEKLIISMQLVNVIPVLATDYESGLPSGIADRVFAIDMFHAIDNTIQFLNELYRIVKPDGVLYIDYGHQLKERALDKIKKANLFEINETHSQYAVLTRK